MSLYQEARAVIAGGVNSPVRAFAGVGGEPVFFKKAHGAWVETEGGARLIDYVGSWGPMILGHAPEPVHRAAADALAGGWHWGMPNEAEVRLGETLREAAPLMEQMRFMGCSPALHLQQLEDM